jgi:AcrR family transcriptional regulator
MRRVASLAGITLSTLQHHFGNQRNLLIIIINSFGSHYMEMLQSTGRDTSIPPKERFDKAIDQLIDWTVDPIITAAYWELYTLANKDDAISELVDKIFATYYGTLADIVAELNPHLSQARARTIGVMIGTQLDGLSLFHLHGAATKLPLTRLVSAMKVGWMDEIARP